MAKQAADFFTAAELVTRWKSRVTKRTLDNWRCMTPRRGPAFTKIGGRVLYPRAAVLEWEKQNQTTQGE